MRQHKHITIDFTNYKSGTYDLAVPIHLSINKLVLLIAESLELPDIKSPIQIKVLTKGILLVENDSLADFQIANGDILKVV